MAKGFGQEAGGGNFAATAGKRPSTRTTTRTIGTPGNQEARLFVSKQSNKRVSTATTRASHLLPGANTIDRGEAFGDRRIEAGGAPESRASGVILRIVLVVVVVLVVG